jgi:hypothetical protein
MRTITTSSPRDLGVVAHAPIAGPAKAGHYRSVDEAGADPQCGPRVTVLIP